MRNTGSRLLPCVMMLVGPGIAALATAPDPDAPPFVRELFIPVEDLHVLLEHDPHRVMLSREEYESLLSRVERAGKVHPPQSTVISSAVYDARIEDERAILTGRLTLDLLEEGLHAVDLVFSGVGLREAILDESPAPIAPAEGHWRVFIEGRGTHSLTLEMVTPIETTAARQVMNVQLPTPSATRFHLEVPGDVEILSGASTLSREIDEDPARTRFELLPTRDRLALVMTLNSRSKRQDRVVIARSVVVDEITAGVERIHATFSMDVLHRGVDRFTWRIPEGFDIKQVQSSQLDRWSIETENDERHLVVDLRETTTDTVVLNISAERLEIPWDDWAFPVLQPIDVEGHVSVLGLLLEERIQSTRIRYEDLIAINTTTLLQALPASVFQAEPGALRVRPVVAFYAPQREFQLASEFVRPEPRLRVNQTLTLTLNDGRHQLHGGFTLAPEVQPLFDFTFQLPARWKLASVTTHGGGPLEVEEFRLEDPDEPVRYRVRLPNGVPPATESMVYIEAETVPDGWLDDWDAFRLRVHPVLIENTHIVTGALGLVMRDDLAIRRLSDEEVAALAEANAETAGRLEPIDDDEKAEHGLGEVDTELAYRFSGLENVGHFDVTRRNPRVTAQVWNFFNVAPDVLSVHSELLFEVREARARLVRFALPLATPPSIQVVGLDGVSVKESVSEETDDGRLWTIHLAEPRRGAVRLAVSYQQPLPEDEMIERRLPVPQVRDILYQSGFLSLEGDAELDVTLQTELPKVDVGELADARYLPGKRLLAAHRYVGGEPDARFTARRHPFHELKTVIVERAEIATNLSAQGCAQALARYALRTKADYLEVILPSGAELWSVRVDGRPAKPQRLKDRILVSFPPQMQNTLRELQLVYDMPIAEVGYRGSMDLDTPQLFVGDGQTSIPVPVANLKWAVYVPTGLDVLDSTGTLSAMRPRQPELALVRWARGLAAITGGVNPFYQRGWGLRERVSLGLDVNAVGSAVQEGDEACSAETAPMENVDALMLEDFVTDPAGEPADMAELEEMDGDGDADAVFFGTRLRGTRLAPPKALLGIHSLSIDLDPAGRLMAFTSLGEDPQLRLDLIDRGRQTSLCYGLAGLVLVIGLALSRSSGTRKASYCFAIALLATLLPLLFGIHEWTPVFNASFHAAVLLAVYFVMLWMVLRLYRGLHTQLTQRSAPATAAMMLVAVLLAPRDVQAEAQSSPMKSFLVQGSEILEPVNVPHDAILVPYNPEEGMAVPKVDKILVPYARYIELLQLADPQRHRETLPPPVPYAWAGGAYEAELGDTDELRIDGEMHFQVYTDELVSIPLPLTGGVLSAAQLDGKPARLSAVQPIAQPRPQPQQQAQRPVSVPNDSVLVLHVEGQGEHVLRFTVSLPLHRQGGWRLADLRLPTAPATALSLIVAEERTEVRLRGVQDRPHYVTEQPDQRIVTALEMGKPLRLQWRPRVSEGQVDRTLTAHSDTLFDIQEDGLRLTWQTALRFERGERDAFQFLMPEDYLIAKVAGENVRGWELREEGGIRLLDVQLLKPARNQESITFHLWRPGRIGSEMSNFKVPVIEVRDAALHQGFLAMRRSPLIEVRTATTEGVTRDDFPDNALLIQTVEDQSPLGLQPFHAYRFTNTDYTIQIDAEPQSHDLKANVRNIMRIGRDEQSLETEVRFFAHRRPLYHLSMLLPADLRLDQVQAPQPFEWTVAEEDDHQRLDIYLAAGQTDTTRVLLSGKIGPYALDESVPLPRFEVLDVKSQSGDLAIQVDPDDDVHPEDTENLRTVSPTSVRHWIETKQRPLTKLAFHYNKADYSGSVRLTPRVPHVKVRTITNLRITEQAVMETILLDYSVTHAGIQTLSFTLPAGMDDARIRVPQLRRKTIVPVSDEPDARLRVTLELQDRLMKQIRVLVENDRPLTGENHAAPVPEPENVDSTERLIVLESAGREEVLIVQQAGLEQLNRQQKLWKDLVAILGNQVTEAFAVEPGADSASLAVRIQERELVETAGARIGLAQTVLVVDAQGTYRGVQTYRVDNRTEQYLELELPASATLWTAYVAGEPVKPAQMPPPAPATQLRIPLVKTADGDLDYEVQIKYGGTIATLTGRAGKIDFPFMKTLNINVELSQVELYLPEDHNWFDFDGTMTRVREAGDYLADELAYQTQKLEKLSRSMRSKSEYAKVRALNNWGVLKQEVEELRQRARTTTGNPRLQRELASNDAILDFGEKEQRKAAEVFVQEDLRDNRMQLDVYFEQQDNKRSSGTITETELNFSYDLGEGGGQKGQRFDDRWFASNALSQTETITGVDGPPAANAQAQPGKANEKLYGGNIVADLELYQNVAGQSVAGVPQQRLAEEMEKRVEKLEAAPAGRLNKASRYHQQLQTQMEVSRRAPRRDRTSPIARDRLEETITRLESAQGGATSAEGAEITETLTITNGSFTLNAQDLAGTAVDGSGVSVGAFTPVPSAPQGLASLDVEIPRVGKRFRFSTPRGDVQITARTVTDSTLETLTQWGIAAATVLLLITGYLFFRPGGYLGRNPKASAHVLIILGLLSLMTGLFPLAGALMLIAGLVVRLRQATQQPVPA